MKLYTLSHTGLEPGIKLSWEGNLVLRAAGSLRTTILLHPDSPPQVSLGKIREAAPAEMPTEGGPIKVLAAPREGEKRVLVRITVVYLRDWAIRGKANIWKGVQISMGGMSFDGLVILSPGEPLRVRVHDHQPVYVLACGSEGRVTCIPEKEHELARRLATRQALVFA